MLKNILSKKYIHYCIYNYTTFKLFCKDFRIIFIEFSVYYNYVKITNNQFHIN